MSAQSRRATPANTRADSDSPSGRLLLRMPRTLHGALSEAAEREGTSLNQFITSTLGSAIGWNGEGNGADAARAVPGDSDRIVRHPSRTLMAVLIANAIAVGLAALGAVGILLLAWLG